MKSFSGSKIEHSMMFRAHGSDAVMKHEDVTSMPGYAQMSTTPSASVYSRISEMLLLLLLLMPTLHISMKSPWS
jgi:hypothetical protein